ncbi:MAG: SGNH hydrolase domain-containing protein, partial [Cyanobacteria bacterium J06649_11]
PSLSHTKNWIGFFSVLIVVSLMFFKKDFQSVSTIATVAFTSTLLWSFSSKSFLVRILSAKWMVQIGLLSYSLYLWHWSVLVLSRWTIGVSRWTIFIQLLLTVVLALVSNHWIEKPFRYSKWSQTKLKTIGYGFSFTFISALLLGSLINFWGEKLFSGQYLPDSYKRSFKISEEYQPCEYATSVSTNFAECSYPPFIKDSSVNPPKTVYFVGDSHTNAIQALVSRLVEKGDVSRIAMFSRNVCFFSNLLLREPPNGNPDTKCLDSNRVFLSKVLASASAGDIVVVTNRYKLYFLNPNYEADIPGWRQGYFDFSLNGVKFSREESLAAHTKELVEIAEKFSEKDISLVVQAPLPDWKHLPHECQSQWFRPFYALPETCSLDESFETENRATLLTSFYKMTEQSKNIYVYDPFPVFCNLDNCSSIATDGTPFFLDDDHLNNYGAEHLYNSFTNFLKMHSLL